MQFPGYLSVTERSSLLCLFYAAVALTIAPAHAESAHKDVVLHNFSPSPQRGATPYGGVIRDASGNLYGTTVSGGAYGYGAVYELNRAGKETVLYSFTGGADGAKPYAGLIRDAAGNLYGTTQSGGNVTGVNCISYQGKYQGGCGVVFELDATGRETVLYTFLGGADGAFPWAGVMRDQAGNLYGTTMAGGASNAGVVYRVLASGQQSVIYSFTGGADGGSPLAGLSYDATGNFYGTTACGGTGSSSYCQSSGGGAGVVFRVNLSGKETVIYNFTGKSDGANPWAAVSQDSAGNLYGTTTAGGSGACASGCGVVFMLNSSGQEAVLHSFSGGTDGNTPYAGVTLDGFGNLYGTTVEGGTGKWGVVFKLDTAGDETVLYNFTDQKDGGAPRSGVILDANGNLYGTTTDGGAGNDGAVYQLSPAGQETVMFGFPPHADGSFPQSSLALDAAGNFYGTTTYGGASNEGIVYKLDNAGHENVLYTFGGSGGSMPYAGVLIDAAGNLFGTASAGGTGRAGVVYKLDTAGNQTVLYNFTGGADGGGPLGNLIRDVAGNFYGTAYFGGTLNAGVVFELSPEGHETVLYSFTGGADGGYPWAGLARDSAGHLYGTTAYGGSGNAGVVFELDAAGQETVLYSFTGKADGGYPFQGVIRDTAGNLYGATSGGGIGSSNCYRGCGVVYKLDTAGNQTVLYSFTGASDGGNPYSAIVRDDKGSLYGTAAGGGDNSGTLGHGVVYSVSPAGTETVLHTFTGRSDGAIPYGGLVADAAGTLCGTTSAGGKQNAGVVYLLTP